MFPDHPTVHDAIKVQISRIFSPHPLMNSVREKNIYKYVLESVPFHFFHANVWKDGRW